jgi:hypothetical protein
MEIRGTLGDEEEASLSSWEMITSAWAGMPW